MFFLYLLMAFVDFWHLNRDMYFPFAVPLFFPVAQGNMTFLHPLDPA